MSFHNQDLQYSYDTHCWNALSHDIISLCSELFTESCVVVLTKGTVKLLFFRLFVLFY